MLAAVLFHLLRDGFQARRDAHIRFLQDLVGHRSSAILQQHAAPDGMICRRAAIVDVVFRIDRRQFNCVQQSRAPAIARCQRCDDSTGAVVLRSGGDVQGDAPVHHGVNGQGSTCVGCVPGSGYGPSSQGAVRGLRCILCTVPRSPVVFAQGFPSPGRRTGEAGADTRP